MHVETHDFGKLCIGDHFIIGEMDEGENIDIDVVAKIIAIARQRFGNGKWAYISNRVNSYSLQPLVHEEAPKFERNMIAFGVVVSNRVHRHILELERAFTNGQYPFEFFDDLQSAIDWVTEVLEHANSKS